MAQRQGFDVERLRYFKLLANVYIAFRSLANLLPPHESIVLFDPEFERAGLPKQLQILARSMIPLALTAPIVLAERLAPPRGESFDVVLRKTG
jgi:hypothetical protein